MRILLFNQQTRNAKALVETLFNTCSTRFDKAIFCSNITFQNQGYKAGACPFNNSLMQDLTSMNTSADDVGSLRVQHELKTAWEAVSKDTEAFVISTIEEAVDLIRSWKGDKEIFVTGSLHLVGGVFVILDEPKK
jgi:folylpolyglutamate synthase